MYNEHCRLYLQTEVFAWFCMMVVVEVGGGGGGGGCGRGTERKGNRNAAGSPSVAPGCGPRNVTDNIWCSDMDESIINMAGWGEWVREGGGSGWQPQNSHRQPEMVRILRPCSHGHAEAQVGSVHFSSVQFSSVQISSIQFSTVQFSCHGCFLSSGGELGKLQKIRERPPAPKK